MARIDTHHHCIPALYRKVLQTAGIDEAGGRALPSCPPPLMLRRWPAT
ncbi:amidohydrolase [Mycolicibacterium phlei]|nr:amidohydrolase [Mycolicibacterium phlei]